MYESAQRAREAFDCHGAFGATPLSAPGYGSADTPHAGVIVNRDQQAQYLRYSHTVTSSRPVAGRRERTLSRQSCEALRCAQVP
jgi:hypothetical protein